MSDQAPSPNQDSPSPMTPTPIPPAQQDWRDLRRAERAARHEERLARRESNNTAWIGGIILIVLGIVFLLQSLRGFYLNNWWALFILIPALGSFADAWNTYRQHGRVSRRVRGELVSGCVFLLVTATFLFNWNWGVVLPILLILWGITLLLNSLLPE
ncbi:MAG TPA: hypothetical protein VMP08_26480 [Anaerolineae bacterium]|nr:hypothetical protein [Anaerolineae bacterium]